MDYIVSIENYVLNLSVQIFPSKLSRTKSLIINDVSPYSTCVSKVFRFMEEKMMVFQIRGGFNQCNLALLLQQTVCCLFKELPRYQNFYTLSTSFENQFYFFLVPLSLGNGYQKEYEITLASSRISIPSVKHFQHTNSKDFLRTVYCDKRFNLLCVPEQQGKLLASFWLKHPFNDRQQHRSVLHEKARKCHICFLMQRDVLSSEIVHLTE